VYLPRNGIRFPRRPECGQGYRSWYSDSLLTGRSWDRIRVKARFSTLARQALGLTHLLYDGYSIAELNRSGRGVDHLRPSTSEAKNEWCRNPTPPASLHNMDRVKTLLLPLPWHRPHDSLDCSRLKPWILNGKQGGQRN